MKKVFAEIGFGNGTFLSTEVETDGSEYRIPRFICPEHIEDYYLRLWLFKRVFVISTKDGFKFVRKNKSKLKIVFGVGGGGN